jgi:phosphoenolpyruvate synthase/pyruvate phosphate dikinase
MSYIRSLDEIRLTDRAWAGEKAAHLGELVHAGFDVPRGLCITADAYRDALAANQIDPKISARLAATEIDDPVDLEQAAEEIRAWIESTSMPASITQDLQTALDSLDAKALYAVRASRVVDDVPNPAASGLQQAYLGVPHVAMLNHVRKCWTVPWNSRAIYYRHRKKIDSSTLTMAVVVQPMLNADAAGVMFTANPLTGADEIHIDATWGLGEAIIAARWKPDHFVVEKNNHTIQERVVAIKSVMELVAPVGGLQSIAMPENKQEVACLSDEQITTLATLGERVAAHFKSPQDIEWCRVGDKIYLLQTRPLAKR